MYLLNLPTTPNGHLIKTGTFLQKNDSSWEKYTFARRLDGLNSIKFLEILNSNKTPNILSTYQLNITFKPLNFVCKPFLMCFKIRTPLGLKHSNLKYFHLFDTVSTQGMYINKKLHTSHNYSMFVWASSAIFAAVLLGTHI